MLAAVCSGFQQPLVVEELDLDAPVEFEVTVRVSACGICHSDISFIDGAWGGALPAVYGHEVAGVVTETGAGVETMKTGDEVVVTLVRSCGRCFYCLRGEVTQCNGRFAIDERGPLRLVGGSPVKQGMRVAGFAEYVTVHQSQVVPITTGIPPESACLLACSVATGVGAVRNTAELAEGASVVVIGAGGVGLNSIQGAALMNAKPLIAVDVSNTRLEAARFFGASDVINSKLRDPIEAIRGLTEGRGADYTFVSAGSASAIELGIAASRRAGTVVIVGITATGVTVPVDPGELADSARRVLGSKMGSIRPQVDIPELVDLYRSGRLKLDELITARFPLDRINEALDATRRGQGLRTVIVF
ncbi:MAG TPA: Zn-dependent alcohol dehydrogenase [Candidatus Dormibacteraeota bacterium]|nr:Zn-dependent alcohol dehydrogenase [Candidatus Dormibacteraeota bacterium]